MKALSTEATSLVEEEVVEEPVCSNSFHRHTDTNIFAECACHRRVASEHMPKLHLSERQMPVREQVHEATSPGSRVA